MKLLFTAYMLVVFASSSLLAQQVSQRRYNAFSGTTVLSIEGGPTFGQTDYSGLKVDYLGKGSLEYFFPTFTQSSFGLRLFGGGGFISGKDVSLTPAAFRTKLSFAGGGVIYALSIKDDVFPYIFAGASYLWFNPIGENGLKLPNNAAGVYKKHEINYNGELGFRTLLTDNLSFNLSGGIQISPNDYLDDKQIGTSNDMFYYAAAGFSFSFFTEFDHDGDGVVDSKDMCPNTPQGVKVDEFGCPIDSDHDGVPDYLDKCPDTPKGVKVDKYGCPLDTDGDGVPDYRDICANTPKGVKVDDLGCPFDSDGDGVPDYLDKCPNTPNNVKVDKDGCPVDSDHDGVPDYKDNCPNTPVGTRVDTNGCPIVKAPEVKHIILSAGTNFAFGKTELLPSAYKELDKVVKVMREDTGSNWRIIGYTDNVGSAKVNKKVSLKRAESVLDYFLSKGLDRNRYRVVGMGESNPVASNHTEAGRAMNRRVEIIRIN